MRSECEVSVRVRSTMEILDAAGVPDSDAEQTDIRARGRMICRDGAIRLSYREATEGGEVTCEITVIGARVGVCRRGAAVCDLHFCEGAEDSGIYEVPPYRFDVSIKTAKIRNTLTERGGSLTLFYTMTLGGVSKKTQLRVDVTPD